MSGFLSAEAIGQRFTFLRSDSPGSDSAKETLDAVPAGLTREAEICARRKDGTLYKANERILPFRDDAGQVRYFILTWTDVVNDNPSVPFDRFHREQLLALIGGPDEVVSEIDAEGRFRSIWVKDETLLTRPRNELLGQKIDKYFDPWLGSVMEAHIRGVLETGKAECIEYSLEVIGGTKWFLGWITPIPSPAGPAETIRFAARDITAIRQMEEPRCQARELVDIAQLAETIARDSCDLMTVIGGYSELLAARPAQEQAQRYLSEIRKAWLEANELTRQLHQIAHPVESEIRTLDLNAIIEDLRDTIRLTLGEAATLNVDLDPTLPMIAAEPDEMQRLIINLLREASGKIPDGGRLSIKTESVELGAQLPREQSAEMKRSYVRLVLCAGGGGVDCAPVESVFEDLYSVEPIELSAGLHTVHEIVKRCGGWVSTDCRTAEGARVAVYLPRVDDRDIALTQIRQSAPAAAGGNETILVVDGCQALRRLTETVLLELGYKVLLAENGETALQVASSHAGPIDLLVTEVEPERLSGPELARRLRQSIPGLKALYTSGYASQVETARRVFAGGAALLPKPYTPEALAMKIRDVLAAPAPEGVILVVDDEPGVRILLRHTLSMAGFQVAEACDRREAVWIVESLRPDLVVTDVVMPRCDGIALMRELRNAHPAIPTIALAGRSHDDSLAVARKLGALATFAKPIDSQRFLATLRDIFRNVDRRSSAELSADRSHQEDSAALGGDSKSVSAA